MVSLFEQDVTNIRRWNFRHGSYITAISSNGTVNRRPVKAVRVNLQHTGQWMAGEAFSDWPRVPCMIKTDHEQRVLKVPRLMGPWLQFICIQLQSQIIHAGYSLPTTSRSWPTSRVSTSAPFGQTIRYARLGHSILHFLWTSDRRFLCRGCFYVFLWRMC